MDRGGPQCPGAARSRKSSRPAPLATAARDRPASFTSDAFGFIFSGPARLKRASVHPALRSSVAPVMRRHVLVSSLLVAAGSLPVFAQEKPAWDVTLARGKTREIS